MSTIFISHSSKDNSFAKQLERRLAEQHHPSVFLDLDPEKGIVAGQSWERTLYRKLRACRAVIVVCTDSYLTSQWCFAEIALARMEGKQILALQVDPLSPDAKLPAILTEKQFIDLRTHTEEGYQRLWHGLAEMDLLGVSNEWDPKDSPYLGLNAYDERHAPVFFGRDDETRAGIELLDRGAPGLIMVLGASGSGKSSIVRAGMVPRLRRDPERWLVVGPFRPRRDPFAELAEAFVDAYQRHAPAEARSAETRDRVRALRAAAPNLGLAAQSGKGDAEDTAGPVADERLSSLLKHLEELRRNPPAGGGANVLEFLDWSLDDLKRICGEKPRLQHPEPPPAATLPLVEMADHLRRASGHRDARVLLVIDQFEELLGQDHDRDDAARFLTMVRSAIEVEHSPLMTLGTMRSDFLGQFQRKPALLGIDFESLSVGPMGIDGMRRAIEEPARLATIELEPGLADRLLKDAETPDALPLLSFTLSVLWRDGRADGRLDIREYDNLGGLQGTIAREADAVLDLARKQGKEDDVRRAFLQMARLTEEGAYARQPVSWDRAEIQRVQANLQDFERRRLLVTRMEKGEQRTVEVAHEALFRSWAPLKGWLDSHRGELLLAAQLRRDARAWEDSHRSAGHLWHGGRLQQAEELIRKGEWDSGSGVAGPEVRFVKAGVQRRRLMWGTMAGITASVIVVLSVLLAVAMRATDQARVELRRAQAGELATIAESLSKESPEQSLLLALEAYRIDPVAKAVGLIRAAQWAYPYRVVLRGHEGAITHAQFSPDGQTVLTASRDNTARLWNVESGKELRALRGHMDKINSALFSVDGKTVLTASQDNTARLWNVESGKELRALLGHTGGIDSALFSADGKTVLTASQDHTARLWDLASGNERRILVGHGGAVNSARFSADGETVLTASADKTARLWDVVSGKELRLPLRGHDASVSSARFSADSSMALTASEDGTARLWDVASGKELRAMRGHEGVVTGAQFSADGKTVLTESWDHTARLWDVTSGKELRTLRGHEAGVNSAQFSADGKTVLTASEDKTVRLWDVGSGQVLRALRGHRDRLSSAQFSADGKTVLTASWDNTARLWDLTSGNELRVLLRQNVWIAGAQLATDGKTALTAGGDKTARLWDVASGKERLALVGHDDAVTRAQFSSDGKGVLTASVDKTARLWDVAGGKELRVLRGHTGTVYDAQFSADAKTLLTASQDKTARLWDAATGMELHVLSGHDDMVLSAQFSADDKTVLTASMDKTVRLWDVASGQELRVLRGHEGAVTSARFFTDGKTALTAGWDNTARLWDVASGQELRALRGHEGVVTSAQFSADGKTVLTASRDKTARLWDATSGKEIRALLGHGSWVTSAQFSADGKTVLTASADKSVRLWRCDECRPFNEVHRDVARWVGRGLTDNERRQFGLPGQPTEGK